MVDSLSSERWARALTAAVDRKWARSRTVLFAFMFAAWAAMCVALWRLGYPGWRVAALAGDLVTVIVLHAWTAITGGKLLPEGDGRAAFALVMGAVVLTGGLHSPLLIGVTGQLSGVVLRCGWNRQTRRAIAVFILAVIALALVPVPWVGPRIPDPTFTTIVVFVVVLSAITHADYMVMAMTTARDAIRQLLQARDERASEALARAAELERMSSHLSHELKNPLGAIKALVQLSARAERDPDIRARLEVVDGEVHRMQAILEGYLSFSRPLDTLRPEPVALGPLVDEVLAILEARADGARVGLRRNGDAEITADPRRLKEALLNLVANAIEATPPGGEVETRVIPAAGQARIEVRDTGRGMPPAVLARLGTPFFTTREKGTGLGVLLARGVFAQHGGKLEYASEPGHGTVATGILPDRFDEKDCNGPCAACR
ncbi:MAG: HAMP domain-containing sensor histidine kinase [Anaeromyxobacteraceae bacterium]